MDGSDDDKPLSDTIVDPATQEPAVPAEEPTTKPTKTTGAADKDKEKEPSAAVISPPFSLIHRFTPPEKSHCYMMGTVNGLPKKIVTNISVQMSHDFVKIMNYLLEEAKAGKFATKGEAVKRRNEMLAAQPAAPAESGSTAVLAESGEDVY